MGAADPGQRPWRAPAVAVEHRQRPQIDAVLVEGGVDDLSEAVQVGAAVGVDHTLGPARRAGGVVDGDRGQLVLDRPFDEVIGPAEGELGVANQPRAGQRDGPRVRSLASVSVLEHDDLGDGGHVLDRGSHLRQEGGVGHQHLGARVVQDVGDLLIRQPGVHRDQYGTGERDRELRDEHLGQVGHQVRNPVAGLYAARPQRVRHPGRLFRELSVGQPALAVDDGCLVREDPGRPLQERQRGQRGVRDQAHECPSERVDGWVAGATLLTVRSRKPPAARWLYKLKPNQEEPP